MTKSEQNKLVRRLLRAAHANEIAKKWCRMCGAGQAEAFSDGAAFAFIRAARIVKGEK